MILGAPEQQEVLDHRERIAKRGRPKRKVTAPPPSPPVLEMPLPPAVPSFLKGVTALPPIAPVKKVKRVRKPETEEAWTLLYYGPRGSCKSQHQARVVMYVLEYLDWLYFKNPQLKHHAIVYSIQKFNKDIESKYLGDKLYYWDAYSEDSFRYCPRTHCWRGDEKHKLHGAYLVFDDMATFLPADGWANTPLWMRKLFAQARHNGIRVIANVQDPMSCDVNFRRYTDLCYKFTKIFGSKDPDETKLPIKRVWGLYIRRKIKAQHLWQYGDMTESEIAILKATEKERAKQLGIINYFKDAWVPSFHWLSRKNCELYDTTQDVPEYRALGFKHSEMKCLDGCGYTKKIHELI